MSEAMTKKQMKAKLKNHGEAVAKERDELRDFASEVDDLADTCDRAYDSIRCAIDALSELA
jgi:hypothetical protein